MYLPIWDPRASPEGHSTIILLDGINGYFENFAWARQGVIGLMPRLPLDEKIALYVVQNGDGLGLLQDYTTDRARLTDAISHYIVRTACPSMCPAPPWTPAADDGQTERPASNSGPAPPNAAKASPREKAASVQGASEAVRLSLQALAEKLRSLPGRKSVFWITQGFPPRQLRDMNRFGWDKTITALNDANIQVNTVDNNGLGGPPRQAGPGGILTMQQIAEETGGQAYFHRNDLDAAIASGIADSRRTYTLGFYLTELDGKYHELKVRVGRPGLELNYRQGYYARNDAVPDLLARKSDLESVLLNPQGSAAVGITASIDITPGNPRGTLTAHLKLSPESLSIKESPAGWTCKIEELFLELNAEGREVGRISGVKQFEINRAQKQNYDVQGATLSTAVQLAPEATNVSIIVRDSASGRTGTLTIPLGNIAQRKTEK